MRLIPAGQASLWVALGCAGCSGPPAGDGPPHASGPPTTADTGGPAPTAPTGDTGDTGSPPTPLALAVQRADADVYLAWRATLSGAPEGAEVEVHLTGADGTARTWADDADIALLGLHAETSYQLTVTLAESTLTTGFVTEALPQPFPILEVLAHAPERIAPGHTLVPASHPDHGLLIVLDEALQPVWVAVDDGPWYAAELVGGRIVGIRGDDARWVDWLGQRGRLDSERVLHHDVIATDDGFVALGQGLVEVDAYPTSYDTPEELAPATILDQHVVTYDAEGSELDALALSTVLPTTRCAWNGQNLVAGGYDWLHLNALGPTSDGRFVLSSRTQSALVAMEPDGEVSWILGDPTGWPEDVAPRLLTSVGPLTWPAAQHAPHYDPATGDLWVFDNGGARTTPYDPDADPEPADPTSRLVRYRVDEEAMTVEEAWSWQPDPPVFSRIMGDADPLPDGHVLSVFTWLKETEGTPHPELGWGDDASRVIEVVPGEADPVLDLRLRSDAEALRDGWWTYRVQRIDPIHEAAAAITPPTR